MSTVTDAQRDELFNRAITAIREHFTALLLTTDDDRIGRAAEVARLAVTDAVVWAGIPYSHLAQGAGCTGLHVAELLTDPIAQARALRDERRAAEDQSRRVREALRRYAARVVAMTDHGAVSEASRLLGVTRETVYAWADEGG